MTGVENRVDDGAGSDATLRFVMTLIVSTLMAAVTAWVLSYAVMAPARVGAATHATSAIQHVRS